jgi:hypothetical protein
LKAGEAVRARIEAETCRQSVVKAVLEELLTVKALDTDIGE